MKKVDKETIDISKFLWEQEKESMKKHTDRDFSELIEVLDPLINSGKVLYTDFREVLTKSLEKYLPNNTEDTIENRKKAVTNAFRETTEFYKQLI